jgi:hypothetical protein
MINARLEITFRTPKISWTEASLTVERLLRGYGFLPELGLFIGRDGKDRYYRLESYTGPTRPDPDQEAKLQRELADARSAEGKLDLLRCEFDPNPYGGI